MTTTLRPQLLAGFNNGIRRAESSAWRTDPAGGSALVRNLQNRIDSLTGAVHLVQPAVGTYSLSSSDSPVVVTVSNQLPRPVTVLVGVTPAAGVIGFQAPGAGAADHRRAQHRDHPDPDPRRPGRPVPGDRHACARRTAGSWARPSS